MKVLARVCVCLSVCALLAGCATNSAYVPKVPPQAMAHILEYNELPGNKVFILAVDPSGKYAFGVESGKSSVKAAAKSAVEQCDASREAFGIVAKPYVYAVNNDVVYEDMINKEFKAQK